jgi:hypothetical protein
VPLLELILKEEEREGGGEKVKLIGVCRGETIGS